jgi:hypothetical protein
MMQIMKILNKGNAKTKKGEKFGYKTFGIHLAPSTLSGFNACLWASKACIKACLNTAGHGQRESVQIARIEKTKKFFQEENLFMEKLVEEITAAIKSAKKANLTPCFRLNLTSDIPWEAKKINGQTLFELFPQVSFYDYTKSFNRMKNFLSGKMPQNYHLTFSRSESNEALCELVAKLGGNVAVVFRNSLPEKYLGKKVIDGDKNDLRFLDPKNSIVGLIEKGKAKNDESGFVVCTL